MQLNGSLIYRRCMAIAIATFALLLLSACGDKYQKANNEIGEYLKAKYGEDFVVNAIGDGTGIVKEDTIKAEVYVKKDPNKKFMAEIKKDYSEIWDGYMYILMAEKIDPDLTQKAKSIFGDDLILKTEFDTGTFPDPKLNNRALLLKEFPYYSLQVRVFVQTLSPIDKDNEVVKIDKFLADLINFGIHQSNVNVFYVTSNNGVEQQTIGTWAQIYENKKKQTTQEILNNFN